MYTFGFILVFIIGGVLFTFDKLLFKFCSEFDEKEEEKK